MFAGGAAIGAIALMAGCGATPKLLWSIGGAGAFGALGKVGIAVPDGAAGNVLEGRPGNVEDGKPGTVLIGSPVDEGTAGADEPGPGIAVTPGGPGSVMACSTHEPVSTIASEPEAPE